MHCRTLCCRECMWCDRECHNQRRLDSLGVDSAFCTFVLPALFSYLPCCPTHNGVSCYGPVLCRFWTCNCHEMLPQAQNLHSMTPRHVFEQHLDWANRETETKKNADSTFALPAIRTHCFFHVFQVGSIAHTNVFSIFLTYPRRWSSTRRFNQKFGYKRYMKVERCLYFGYLLEPVLEIWRLNFCHFYHGKYFA